ILQSMDPGPLVNAASGFLWGDYEGLTAARNTFYGVFTGASDGRATPQLDPMFFRQKSCRWWSLSCWSNPSSSPRLSAPRGAVWRATMKSIPWAAARRAFLGAAALTSALVLG